MLLSQSTGYFVLALQGLALFSPEASGVILYRVGTPFTAAEKDSLQNLGIDFREIDWSFLALEEGLELDSLSAGSLQPNFFDEDENIARTALLRGGRISINITGQENTLLAQVLLDGDPSTAYVWPEATGVATRRARVTLDLGGKFLVKKVSFRPLAENPGRFLENFGVGIGNELTTTSCGQCIASLPLANIQKPSGIASGPRINENTDPDVTALLNPPSIRAESGMSPWILRSRLKTPGGRRFCLAQGSQRRSRLGRTRNSQRAS